MARLPDTTTPSLMVLVTPSTFKTEMLLGAPSDDPTVDHRVDSALGKFVLESHQQPLQFPNHTGFTSWSSLNLARGTVFRTLQVSCNTSLEVWSIKFVCLFVQLWFSSNSERSEFQIQLDHAFLIRWKTGMLEVVAMRCLRVVKWWPQWTDVGQLMMTTRIHATWFGALAVAKVAV
mmetsp:Transcript_5708/g.7596  ORF Transcript_5708/g.7596 Transcript_5708/m.7596 type:complete len:176 (-) Transcript_5708:6-533(-)